AGKGPLAGPGKEEPLAGPGKEPATTLQAPAPAAGGGPRKRRPAVAASAPGDGAADHAAYSHPAPPRGVNPIGSLAPPGRATVEGRVRTVEIRPVERSA